MLSEKNTHLGDKIQASATEQHHDPKQITLSTDFSVLTIQIEITFTHSLIYLLIISVNIFEHLGCARHCARSGDLSPL